MKYGKAMMTLLAASALVVAFSAALIGSAGPGKNADLGRGGPNGLLHGDTSVPDEELIKLYGDKMPEEVFLKTNCKKMAPPLFKHKEHVDRKIARCGACHHKKPTEIKSCAECHVLEPEEKEVLKYKDAHHGLCRKCHKARRKGREGPPVKCTQCHKKENTEKAGVECPVPKDK